MAERDSTLADFQACTGLENLDDCIAILEQHDWNLETAVQTALLGREPAEVEAGLGEPQISHEPLQLNHDSFIPQMPDDFILGGTTSSLLTDAANRSNISINPFSSLPTTSFANNRDPPTRLLEFLVEYLDATTTVVLGDYETVGKLKQLLEQQFNVPVSKQRLHGWVHKTDTQILDTDLLRDLRLPKQNNLVLHAPDVFLPPSLENNTANRVNSQDNRSKMYSLHIHYKDNNQTYQVNFPGSRSIREVKSDMFDITQLPVRHQRWTGWPEVASSDTMLLANCRLNSPHHDLELASGEQQNNNHEARQVEDDMEVEDSDVEQENFVDLSDTDEIITNQQQPLIPDNTEDQTVAIQLFEQEFVNRYGNIHPVFYHGTLDDAIRTSLYCKARERKLLAVYLHHDRSILSNVFCSQVLCVETTVTFLVNNFITWPWDLTFDSNKETLLNLCTRHFGTIAARTVRDFKPDQLPLLLLISRNRGASEVVGIVHGNSSLDELMMQLISTVEIFKQQQQTEIREEDEREARERMLAEQDEAYQKSLAADRAKEESKKRELEERKRREEEKQRMEDKRALLKEEKEAEKEAIRQSLVYHLTEEPPADCTEPVCTVRIRCPDRRTLMRRFYVTDSLEALLNYITIEGFHYNDYKVLTTYPRRDLTQEDHSGTLEQLKLCAQETLTLEEL